MTHITTPTLNLNKLDNIENNIQLMHLTSITVTPTLDQRLTQMRIKTGSLGLIEQSRCVHLRNDARRNRQDNNMVAQRRRPQIWYLARYL
ncbi:hypothetical protein K1T71_011432 [Dendrolimus kikuchii]|uniref:Uncharacterized protein n=1 Tax=Dendrolimus kikuchii TaxID=765133 RepID=A0ACC1CP72_9NEOP|nr:hypothetical protein K1T71_011432 [Dendrolimus kikuchii]